jgi:hypothetical protein
LFRGFPGTSKAGGFVYPLFLCTVLALSFLLEFSTPFCISVVGLFRGFAGTSKAGGFVYPRFLCTVLACPPFLVDLLSPCFFEVYDGKGFKVCAGNLRKDG